MRFDWAPLKELVMFASCLPREDKTFTHHPDDIVVFELVTYCIGNFESNRLVAFFRHHNDCIGCVKKGEEIYNISTQISKDEFRKVAKVVWDLR